MLRNNADARRRSYFELGLPVMQAYFYPRTYKGGGGRCMPPPLSFLLEDKTSAPDVFSHCSFIHRAHSKLSSVMVSSYGYEI